GAGADQRAWDGLSRERVGVVTNAHEGNAGALLGARERRLRPHQRGNNGATMRRRRWVRRIGALLGTVALGAVLGFLIPTIVAEYSPKTPTAAPATSSLPANATELPIA